MSLSLLLKLRQSLHVPSEEILIFEGESFRVGNLGEPVEIELSHEGLYLLQLEVVGDHILCELPGVLDVDLIVVPLHKLRVLVALDDPGNTSNISTSLATKGANTASVIKQIIINTTDRNRCFKINSCTHNTPSLQDDRVGGKPLQPGPGTKDIQSNREEHEKKLDHTHLIQLQRADTDLSSIYYNPLDQYMLKELFSRIKSEKSKSNSVQSEQLEYNRKGEEETQQSIPSLTPYTLCDLELVETIPTIQYGVLQGFPDLTASILSCPITFHVLPYSNRRVKEISTHQHLELPEYARYLLQTFATHLHNPNHFLINDYPPGIGIMPHFDGPAYHPKVVVYSIGTAVIKFINKESGEEKSLLLEDKSLHIFEDEAYTLYMHGIQDYTIDYVFIKVQGNEITNSSVENIKQTRIYKQLIKQGLNSLQKYQIGDIGISKISENQEYTHQISIPRQRRFSITIRHKYP